MQPPGTGKSLLAEAVAGEASNMNFFFVSSSDLVSKYQGVSESLVRNLFKVASSKKPAIIYISEIDSLGLSRRDTDDNSSRRIKTELLVQMDTITRTNGVFVMAATNTPADLDDALVRRFDKLIYVPLPKIEDRKKMFQQKFSNSNSFKFTDEDFNNLAMRTHG